MPLFHEWDSNCQLSVNLGVDPRHADQMVRGVVSLPNGTGKTVRVAVFARGDKADEAKSAGADIVGRHGTVAAWMDRVAALTGEPLSETYR